MPSFYNPRAVHIEMGTGLTAAGAGAAVAVIGGAWFALRYQVVIGQVIAAVMWTGFAALAAAIALGARIIWRDRPGSSRAVRAAPAIPARVPARVVGQAPAPLAIERGRQVIPGYAVDLADAARADRGRS